MTTITEQSPLVTPGSPFDALLARQEELEARGYAEGIDRHRRRVREATERGQATQAGATRSIFVRIIDPIEETIKAWVKEYEGQRGRPHVAMKWIKAVRPDVAAYLTAQVVLNGLGEAQNYRRIALDIAQRIIDQLRFERLKKEAPALFKYRMEQFETSSYVHRARSLTAACAHFRCKECVTASRTECSHLDWSDLDPTEDVRIHLGTKLLDILLETRFDLGGEEPSPLVEVNSSRLPGRLRRKSTIRTEVVVRPTRACLQWIAKRDSSLELLHPVALPMVVRPLPWGPDQKGGYLYGLRGKFRLIHGFNPKRSKQVEKTDMPEVYAGLNALQNTAWKINAEVLDVIEEFLRLGGGQVGLPQTADELLPPKPHDIAENEEAKAKWKKAAGKVKNRNHQRVMEMKMLDQKLNIAREFRHDSAIYFPWSLDFRGRMYPMVPHLHPQGPDIVKGLLTFAAGRPLGAEGAQWLAIHGANLMDTAPDGVKLSKSSLEDRIAWTLRYSSEIVRCAEDPFESPLWKSADDGDKAWQFLAFCYEWRRLMQWVEAGLKAEEFVSNLPVDIDGTNNGLQHLSAMFRDEVGAHHVNVTPSETPQDIYQRVCDRVNDILWEMSGDDWLAARWLGSGVVKRSFVKRPAMTFSYGAKLYGFSAQLQDVLCKTKAQEEWAKQHFMDPEEAKPRVTQACNKLAGVIWGALEETVVAAVQGMEWMQTCARIIAAKGIAMEWTVPLTGFPVRQEYWKSDMKRVNTVLAGRVFKPRMFSATNTPEPRRQINGISPNVVHSLDAAALALTLRQCAEEGIESLSAVHDSYVTVAGDMSLMARLTRETFYWLHTEGKVVESLYAQFQQLAGEDTIPLPPPMGTLDMALVLESLYLFS